MYNALVIWLFFFISVITMWFLSILLFLLMHHQRTAAHKLNKCLCLMFLFS